MNTLYFYYNTKASYSVNLSFDLKGNSYVSFDMEISNRQRKVLIEKICSSAAEDIIYSLCEEAESRLDDEELEYVKDQCPGWDVVYDKVFDAISCYAQEERRKESFWRASCKDILRVARRKKACYSVRHRGRRGRPKQGRSRSSFVAASSHANSDSGDDDDGGSGDGDGDGDGSEADHHSVVKNLKNGIMVIRNRALRPAIMRCAQWSVFFVLFIRQEVAA
ncbi:MULTISPECIES: hypothetical protein [unclassified Pyramidobacter]|uniref:hypothetical protein n=1 Tax=unclassified Pyramidobacter TaxID=2632171 RepID=UPI000EA3BA94|nr:hypothetical protein [Pyramidobacter sp. CG50-2]